MGELATLGIIVSIAAFLGTIVVALISARARRIGRKNSELEELRELHLAAMGYIFTLERAYQEACSRLGIKADWEALDKPEILNRKFLAEKAIAEGNEEFKEMAAALAAIQEQLKERFPMLPTKE